MAIQSVVPHLTPLVPKFQWTTEAAANAAAKNKFIRVGGDKPTYRFLAGAKRSWESDNPEERNTIFIIQLRITGTPDAIRRALSQVGEPYTPEVIEAYIADAVTRDNYNTTKAAEVNAETEARRLLKERETPAISIEWSTVRRCADNIAQARIAGKGGVIKEAQVAPGRATAGQTLAEKIRGLPAGKVYDVSQMDMNNGKQGRTVNQPKGKSGKPGKTGKFMIPGLQIISNDPTRYERAIQLAFGDEGLRTYAPQIQEFRNQYAAHQAAGRTAVMPAPMVPAPVVRNQSPRGLTQPIRPVAPVPGGTLANPVQFAPRVATPPGGRLQTMGGNLPTLPALNRPIQTFQPIQPIQPRLS